MQLAKITKYANLFDWALGFSCVGYGLYSGNMWWLVGGAVGLTIAAINPTKRVTNRIQAKVSAKLSDKEN